MNNKEEMKKNFRIIDLVYIAFGAVLIAICSWISIPTVVPFTMQTFAIFFVLSAFGGKRGTVAIIIYIAGRGWYPGIFTVHFRNRYSTRKHRGIYRWFYYYGVYLPTDCSLHGKKIVGRNALYGYRPRCLLRFRNRVVYVCLCRLKRTYKSCNGSFLVRNTIYHSRPD